MAAMTWQLIPLDDIPPTAWRNGGGQTRELLAWPTPADWCWRISVAEVVSAGPFSCFAGVRRWLAILAGDGVRLAFAHGVVELSPASAPLAFDGADAVHCSLRDGPVRDLNLMLRGPGCMQRVDGYGRWCVVAGQAVALFADTAPVWISMAGERISVPAGVLAWRSVTTAVELEVEARQAYCMHMGHSPVAAAVGSRDA